MVKEKLENIRLIIITGLLLIIISLLDFMSPNEISFSIFYLLPITFAGWFINRHAGIVVSFLSSCLWLFAELYDNPAYSSNLIPYWNALVRLGIFLCIIYLIGLIKDEREREKDILHFITHDLRSPLATILTAFKMLIEEEQPITKREKHIIDLSIVTGNRMMIFINSILDLGRLEKKKMPIYIVPVNIPGIINEAAVQLRILAEENNIEIRINCRVENLNTDENLLLRIFINLLNNAIKVSDRNSFIELSAEEIDKGKVKFSVTDQGPGIPEELKNKLFGRFNQGSRATSGSGLGLAFCKYAVEALGGYINIESVKGKGTTVFFVLKDKSR